MSKWREVAYKYRQKEPATIRTARETLIGAAAGNLVKFLDSPDGKEALALLKANRRLIVIGEDDPVGVYITVYFLNGDGLQKSNEAVGTWKLYTDPECMPKPKLTAITPLAAVQATINRGKDPEQIVAWLCEELDKIAAAAPEPDRRLADKGE